MDAIIGFFTGIGDILSSIVDFVVRLFDGIAYMVEATGAFIANIPTYFAWLPASAVTTIVAIFGVVVIYKFIGREG